MKASLREAQFVGAARCAAEEWQLVAQQACARVRLFWRPAPPKRSWFRSTRLGQPRRQTLVVAGRRVARTAKAPTMIAAISRIVWAITNGGSLCVGASGCRAGTFWNDWTISTKTLR